MSSKTFTFTGFAESDLTDGHIGRGVSFSQPESATLRFEVADNDGHLSGDRFDHALDQLGQTATIGLDSDTGNGGQIYAEKAFYLHGSDGKTYYLIEIEQEKGSTDYYTYAGSVPAAGVTLMVGGSFNVGGVGYKFLGAGEVASEPKPNIVEIAAGSNDFNILVKALSAAGLVETVQNAEDITVFAPTDAAFIGLAQALGFDGNDEGEAFGYIVKALTLLSGGGDPIPLLTDVLLYHVAPGTLDADAVLSSSTIPTLLGVDLGVDGTSLVDQDPDIADPNIVATNIDASNGIAHAIDGVLLPADLLAGDGGKGTVDFVIGDDGRDYVRTGDNTDFVSGEGGNDAIRLGAGNDVGLGGAGNDRLYGGRDNDRLDGGDGQDYLVGGRGDDALVGGADGDVFMFYDNAGSDVIEDFSIGEDIIRLRLAEANDFHDLEGRVSDTEDGAVIDLGSTEITLLGVNVSDLSDSDFLFH